MNIPTIPPLALQAGALMIPWLGRMLSNVIKDQRLSTGQNALVAAIVLIVFATGSAWLFTGFSGNAQLDLLLILGYASWVLQGDLLSLDQFFQAVPSPVANTMQAHGLLAAQTLPPARSPRPIRIPQTPRQDDGPTQMPPQPPKG